jgi:DNA-binding Lrp family transcriptional regulator
MEARAKTMKNVLKVLEKDARITPDKVATMTGLPQDEVEKIIAQAEKDKIIVKYKTVIDWSKLGEEQVLALIEVKTAPRRNVGFDSIAERIYSFPQVRSVYLVSGTYDLSIQVVGKNIQEIGDFVSDKLATLDSVQGTVTHFLLKRYKEDGEILTPGERNGRLAITP